MLQCSITILRSSKIISFLDLTFYFGSKLKQSIMKISTSIGLKTILVTMFLSCGHSSSTPNESVRDGSDVLRFRKYAYIDQQGTGLEAFSFLIPSDWAFKGGIQWILDNPAMPAVTSFCVYNPKGLAEFEVFANKCFFWTNNIQLLSMFPPGSKYFGSTVMQPVTAQYALRNMILPAARGNTTGRKVLKDENLPELPLALGAGKQAQAGFGSSGATGAKLRVSYVKDGKEMEEEFYAVVESMSFPIKSMYGTFYNTIWYIDYVFSYKAEKGKLESNTKLFQTITSSIRVNPKWYAKYSNVIEYLAQQQITRIKSVGEFSRMLSRMSDQISDEKMQQFKASGDVYDKVAQKFSDNTLGIDRYFDPHEGREVELPSGYNHAWSNNNGEYIVSDNPNYNPNVGSNLDWRLLEKN
jgi:hypothetical protein